MGFSASYRLIAGLLAVLGVIAFAIDIYKGEGEWLAFLLWVLAVYFYTRHVRWASATEVDRLRQRIETLESQQDKESSSDR